jgi:hypothetical protein
MRRMTVDVQPDAYSIVRYHRDSPLPTELFERDEAGLVSLTRTAGEVSVVCRTALTPAGDEREDGWRLLTVRGPLEFELTGIMASLAGSLAAAGVPLFALSTYDTDHILVKDSDVDRAITALREAGHQVPGWAETAE